MGVVDVFNGDADGICALHQLRLHSPHPEARLVTGVKRDIHLLARIEPEENLTLAVLDISLDKNRTDIERLLARGATIRYIDHHFAGEIPQHPRFSSHIDTDPHTCTSQIINRLLQGAHQAWAAVGAFGDNLDSSGQQLAACCNLPQTDIQALRETGILLNYNGYGDAVEDLFFPPEQLYRSVQPFSDPLAFHADSPVVQTLRQGYRDDMEKALGSTILLNHSCGCVMELNDAPWARRVGGVFANHLANEAPDKAHAIITRNPDGTLRISVRAPLKKRTGADMLCRQFPTGGGRAAAAGINQLQANQLDLFFAAFILVFSATDTPT